MIPANLRFSIIIVQPASMLVIGVAIVAVGMAVIEVAVAVAVRVDEIAAQQQVGVGQNLVRWAAGNHPMSLVEDVDPVGNLANDTQVVS